MTTAEANEIHRSILESMYRIAQVKMNALLNGIYEDSARRVLSAEIDELVKQIRELDN